MLILGRRCSIPLKHSVIATTQQPHTMAAAGKRLTISIGNSTVTISNAVSPEVLIPVSHLVVLKKLVVSNGMQKRKFIRYDGKKSVGILSFMSAYMISSPCISVSNSREIAPSSHDGCHIAFLSAFFDGTCHVSPHPFILHLECLHECSTILLTHT